MLSEQEHFFRARIKIYTRRRVKTSLDVLKHVNLAQLNLLFKCQAFELSTTTLSSPIEPNSRPVILKEPSIVLGTHRNVERCTQYEGRFFGMTVMELGARLPSKRGL